MERKKSHESVHAVVFERHLGRGGVCHQDLLLRRERELPEGGALTQYLNQLNEGDTIDVKGPIGHIVYESGGKLIIDKVMLNPVKMTLMGGGTGVAPMLQLIVAILSDPTDETEIVFIYATKAKKTFC